MMVNEHKQLCTFLYFAYTASMAMMVFPQTMVMGTIAIIIAVGLAYVKRTAAKGSAYESHYTWLIRTFWIGTGVYMPVIILIMMAVIFTMDFSSVLEAASAGNTDVSRMTTNFILQNKGPALYATFGLSALYTAWWLWRCMTGYSYLKDEKPVVHVRTWL